MIHNHVLRSVRFLLDVNDVGIANIIELGGRRVAMQDLVTYLAKEGDDEFVICPDAVMNAFLDGLVVYRRGKREEPAGRMGDHVVTNNTVLKKLRVAFELREDDVLAIMDGSEMRVSKHELRALFRAPGHPNYRPCGDQFLRNFLRALTARLRA